MAPDDYFNQLVEQLDSSLTTLLALPVPSDLADIHLQALLVLGKQRNILALLKNYGQDPLQALLAVQQTTGLYDQLQTLQDSMDAYQHTAKF